MRYETFDLFAGAIEIVVDELLPALIVRLDAGAQRDEHFACLLEPRISSAKCAKMWSAPRQTAPNVDCSTRWIYANQGMSAYTGRMKNPFRKDPTHNLGTTVASLTTRGEQLVAKRATAQLALDEAIKARQHTLLAGDLDDQRALHNLQGLVDTAASTLTGIDDALTVLAHDKAEAEHQIKAEHERKLRANAADKLHKQVAAIEAALPIYLQASRDLADGLSKIDWHFETGQMASFIQSTMGQIEVAANFALAELKSMQEAIRGGQQPAPQDASSMPAVEPVPEPPVMTVFMLRSGEFRDHDGRKQFAGQFEDATMPVTPAHRALRKGYAVLTTDPRRAQLRGSRGGDFNPNAPDVVDLDAEERNGELQHADPILRAANFTKIDRSAEARKIEISVPRV